MAKIGDVCASKIDTLNAAYNGKIDYIDISAVDNDKKKITNTETLQIKEAPSRARQLVECDDIIVSLVRPNLNAVAVVENSSENLQVASTGYCVLRCNQAVYSRYLFYFCQSETFINRMTAQATGASYPAVSNSIVKNCEIPLPERNKQKEIADILDKVTGLISLRKQQLAKLDELVKARFVEMFGEPAANPNRYKKKKLSEIAVYFNGLTYKPENVSDEGMIVLRSSNIQNGKLDFEDVVRVDCAVKEKFVVKENDILMCSRNGSSRLVGKVALIKNVWEPMSFGAFMMIIRSDYYWYLMTYFQMASFREQIKAGTTTTINQITGRMLDSIMIPLPPVDVQNQFATFAERVDQQKQTVQQSLEKLELLKKALMQEYFG